jgi:starvation-inducible DNA-binding protein
MSKSSVTDTLTAILADTYALGVKTHAAHWNVTGPGFFELHAAFSDQYEALLEAADVLAERVRALEGQAPAGIKALAKATNLSDIDATDGHKLAKILRDDHRALSAALSKAITVAQKAGDEATADLFIGRVEAHDKTAWQLAAWAA